MKKFVVAALLAVGAISIYSCNNGDYDADPKNSNPGLNPLDPKSGVKVFLGTAKANLFGTMTEYFPAYYYKDTAPDAGNNRLIVLERAYDAVNKHTIKIGILDFKSMKEYTTSITYQLIDSNTDSLITYFPGKDKSYVELKGEENGNLRGFFSGTFYKKFPYENLNDSIYITDGEFYVPERKLK